MNKSVRMADIAEKLGISVVSVSKGLSGKDGVSDEMRSRILKTAEELGYILKNTQLEEAEPKVRNIGVLVADRFFDDNTFYSSLYRLLVKGFTAAGCSVSLEIIQPEAERERKMPVMVSGNKADALVFLGELEKTYLKTVSECGLPYVLLDFFDEKFPADHVLSDNIHGGYLMAEYLIRKGLKKIGFVGSIKETSSIMDRYLGYIKALCEKGITPEGSWLIEDRNDDGRYKQLELPDEMPEAFVCCNDETAYNLVSLLKEKGLQVPGDVAVTGYDDFRFATLCQPPLTTYHVDLEGMAKRTVDMLLLKLNGTVTDFLTIVVRGNVVIRESA